MLHRFNGAATFRPRKARVEIAELTGQSGLQWGRDLSAAEGEKIADDDVDEDPLQWGRDLSAAEGNTVVIRLPCPLVLQWGRDLSAAEGARIRVNR